MPEVSPDDCSRYSLTRHPAVAASEGDAGPVAPPDAVAAGDEDAIDELPSSLDHYR
jgi:hypothetical protein